jgi:hypothetical protein
MVSFKKNLNFKFYYLSTIFITFLISFSVRAGSVEDFSKFVLDKCPSLNTLMIKKSMIEIIQYEKEACKKTFTGQLVSQCTSVSCDELTLAYKKIHTKSEGNVIGE